MPSFSKAKADGLDVPIVNFFYSRTKIKYCWV